MHNQNIAVWFSSGVASACASKLIIDLYSASNNVMLLNTPILEEHPDNARFLSDCSKAFNFPIISVVNSNFNSSSAFDVWNSSKFMSSIHGAPCTSILKRQARYNFEVNNKIDFHVLGFTIDELPRYNRFVTFERKNVIPILIENNFTKQSCFDYIHNLGISPPKIYSLGFPNANCIGCVKSSSPSYWDLVRSHFPDIFQSRCVQSRSLNCRLVLFSGKRIFLDELPLHFKKYPIKSYSCSLFCDLI